MTIFIAGSPFQPQRSLRIRQRAGAAVSAWSAALVVAGETPPDIAAPPAPLASDWSLADKADSTGLALTLLAIPLANPPVTGAAYSTDQGLTWIDINATLGAITLGFPVGTAVTTILRWRNDVSASEASARKTATPTANADQLLWTPTGTIGTTPPEWTPRWVAPTSYTVQAGRMDVLSPSAARAFLSLDTAGTVNGQFDAVVEILSEPAAGEVDSHLIFWASGAAGSETGYSLRLRQEAGTVTQTTLNLYNAGVLTTPVTVNNLIPQLIGARWLLHANVTQEAAQWRMRARTWRNDQNEPSTWQIDVLVTPVIPTTGLFGILQPNSYTLGYATLALGVNGASAPGFDAAAGGEFVAGSQIFVDFNAATNGTGTTLSPRNILPGSVEAGAEVFTRGTLAVAGPKGIKLFSGGTALAPVKLTGDDATWTGGTPTVLSGEQPFDLLTNAGGIWSGVLPADAWVIDSGTKPDIASFFAFRSGVRMRIGQYPTQPEGGDQLVAKWLPIPLASVTPTQLTIPTTLVSAIPDAATRATVQTDYPAASTLRDLVGAIHAEAALQADGWVYVWGVHNVINRARIQSYDPVTGVLVLADTIDPYTDRDMWFSIANHASALRSDNQVRAAFSAATFAMRAALDPNGQVGYASVKDFLLDPYVDHTRTRGFICEKAACPDVGNAAIRLYTGGSSTRQNIRVEDCEVRLCVGSFGNILSTGLVDSVIRGNHVHDCAGRGITVDFATNTHILGNTVERCTTGIMLRNSLDSTVIANNFLNPTSVHSNAGSFYEKNINLTAVGNTFAVTGNAEAVNNGLTMHQLKNSIIAFNTMITPKEQAFQQWNNNDPRFLHHGPNIVANNTVFHWSGLRAANDNNSFNLSTSGHFTGRVINNVVNSLGIGATEDTGLTFDDPSFAWREVSVAAAVLTSATAVAVTAGPSRGFWSALGGFGEARAITFTTAGGTAEMTLPSWAGMPAGVGIEVNLDLQLALLPAGRLPSVNAELIVTTTLGTLPAVLATWTPLSNGTWSNNFRITSPGDAGTVTSVLLRLKPGPGWVAGTADTINVARPRGWRAPLDRLSQRRRNLITNAQVATFTDVNDVFSGTTTPLAQMIGPDLAQFDLAPRETSPGVLAEPALATGETWTLTHAADPGWPGVTATWIGRVAPGGTAEPDWLAVNWGGIATAP